MRTPRLQPRTLEIKKWLKDHGIPFAEIDERHGFLRVASYACKVASPDKDFYRIKVSLDWFRSVRPSPRKPQFPRLGNVDVDAYLFLEDEALLVLHYLKLRDYALQLELNRDRWQREVAEWGMKIVRVNGAFQFFWNGGNTRRFPLHVVRTIEDFSVQI